MGSPTYLDHHATTPLDPRVREAMLPWLGERFGNPDSRTHARGRLAKEAVEEARYHVAALLGAREDEIVFTSGATESNALALRGVLRPGELAVTQATEHRAVLENLRALEPHGVRTEVVPVDALGRVRRDAYGDALAKRPRLVSVMLANNEVGTAQPLDVLVPAAASAGALFHVDAAQGVGYLPLDVRALPVDFVSLSSHKLYGPTGVGALFVRRSRRAAVEPQLAGGGQEGNLRSGTSNVLGIVGFGCAARLQREEGAEEAARLRALRDALAAVALEGGLFTRNGDPDACHPGNLSLTATHVSADALLLALEDQLSLSTGSACSSGGKPSHVLRALGLPDDAARRTLRLGLGRGTTLEEATTAGRALREAARSLRARVLGEG